METQTRNGQVNLENPIKMFVHRCKITGNTIEWLHYLGHFPEEKHYLWFWMVEEFKSLKIIKFNQNLTWYVLSKLSYINRVISEVLPTVSRKEKEEEEYKVQISRTWLIYGLFYRKKLRWK